MRGQPVRRGAPDFPSLEARFRELEDAVKQLDRRIGGDRANELLVHVGPDDPGRRVGRLWLRPRTPEQS